MNKTYDDIINLPHHVSKVHPRMKIYERAAQFSPFAALTGHDDAIKETARLVDQKLELDENQKAIINYQFNYIKDHLDRNLEVTIIYFQQDDKKIGGTYKTITHQVKKIDDYERYVLLKNGIKILFEDIYDMKIDCL